MTTLIKNLTPHTVTIIKSTGEQIIYMPTGVIPRLSTKTIQVGAVDGIPITSTVFGEVQDMPEQQQDVYLIVSRMVLSALPNRSDLLVPNELVRDSKGMIVGCRSLAKN
jgi:hypothetical protein